MGGGVNGQLSAWKQQGQYLSIFGRTVFVVTAGDPKAPPLCILHGFPTFSYDYAQVLSRLSERYYVVVHDHLGFGLSEKPVDYSYSLIEQAETALGLWQELGISSAHLLAHDYGTSVTTELLARTSRQPSPVDFKSITLCNGSVHIELAQLTLSQRLMRSRPWGPLFVSLMGRSFFKRRFRNLFVRPDAISDQELDVLWDGITFDEGQHRLPQISQYLHERVTFWHRWIGALENCPIPVHVLWGTEDPIAVSAIARKLAEEIPDSTLTWLDGLGHYPMIEDSERWTGAVLEFLSKQQDP